MRPERDNIAAPPLPPACGGSGEDPPRADELTAAGPVLVHFFDFAQLNSVRALPYAIAWDRRYRDAGLATLGVHSPRFRFTADRPALAAALERLGVEHPVADDSGYALWHDYGCEGWPSLFLWGQGGALRWFHFGEGDYAATEAAIAELREHRRTTRPPRAARAAAPERRARAPGSWRRPTRSSPAARDRALGRRGGRRGARAHLRGRRRPRDGRRRRRARRSRSTALPSGSWRSTGRRSTG